MNADFLEILHDIRENPLKYMRAATFDETVAILSGINHATQKQWLDGFQEWITIQLEGGYSNTFWGITSLYVTFPEFPRGYPALSPPNEELARNGLLAQVEQFLWERKSEGLDSLRKRCRVARNEWAERHEDEIFAGCEWVDTEPEQENDDV
ncbi:MAG: hypothetical protein Q4D98_13930 [Planctomycetia bacterium]|nr:hypothetical protein [Planctomycetia bacterium]